MTWGVMNNKCLVNFLDLLCLKGVFLFTNQFFTIVFDVGCRWLMVVYVLTINTSRRGLLSL